VSETTRGERAASTASWLIRIAVVMHVLGIVATVFARRGTSIGNVGLMEWGWTHDRIFLVERWAAVALLGVALSLIVRPTVAAAVVVSATVLAEVTGAYRFGGSFFVEWSHATQILRYLAPLALIPLIAAPRFQPNAPWRFSSSAWILRVGIAVVFAAHGAQALYHDPHFIDLIIGSTRRLTGFRPSEAQAVAILLPIGIVDVTVAALLLVGRWKLLLGWMCFWGLLTACSRVTANGLMSYPEVLLRASHYLAPAAIWALAGYGVPVSAAQRQSSLPAPAAIDIK